MIAPKPVRSSCAAGQRLCAPCAAIVLAVVVAACGTADRSAASTGGSGAYVSIPLSSCISGIYTAPVTIGGSQTFQLAVDTGSTTLAVASSTCSNCRGVSPLYAPAAGAVDLRAQASSQYNIGNWSGEIYRDSVAAGSGRAVPVQLVAIDSQSSFFAPVACGSSPTAYEGVLGLGPAGAAVTGTDGYLDALASDLFAIRLCDTTGTLWLGGYDPGATSAAPVYTPEVSDVDSVYYAVNLASIEVAGVQVQVPVSQFRDTLVDTGSSVFILPTSAFGAVTAAIAGTPGFASVFGDVGASWFSDTTHCRTSSKTRAELDATLPPLTLVFGDGPSVSVQAPATQSYLVPLQDKWCPALYAMDPSARFPVAAVLGSPVLRSSVVIVDRANRRVGFAPATACPG